MKLFLIFWYIPESFVAIAADTNSTDTVWFIQIVEGNRVGDRVLCDDYGHKIAAGANFLKGTYRKRKRMIYNSGF